MPIEPLQKLRFLFVSSLFAPHIGGTETFLTRLQELLEDAGHQVVKAGCKHPQSYTDVALPTLFVGPEWPLPLSGFRRLLDAVKSADVVIANNSRQPLAILALLLCRLTRTPAVLFPHNVDSDTFAETASMTVASYAYFRVASLWDKCVVPPMLRRTKLMVLSHRESELARRLWDVDALRLYYPVAPDEASDESQRASASLRFIWAARFVHQKAPGLAIEAVRAAADRGACFEAHFYGDGPLFEQTRAAAHDLPWVVFHGAVTPGEVKAAQGVGVVLSSSLAEGAQLSILEAMCAGVPAVTTQAGDASSYYPATLNWACVPVADALALADAICRFAAHRQSATEASVANGERLRALYGATAADAIVRALETTARAGGNARAD